MIYMYSYLKGMYYLRKYLKSQYWERDKIKENQEKKFKNLLKYTYNEIPFYHKLYKKNNINPNDIKTLDQINKIPIIEKKDIRLNQQKFFAHEPHFLF